MMESSRTEAALMAMCQLLASRLSCFNPEGARHLGQQLQKLARVEPSVEKLVRSVLSPRRPPAASYQEFEEKVWGEIDDVVGQLVQNHREEAAYRIVELVRSPLRALVRVACTWTDEHLIWPFDDEGRAFQIGTTLQFQDFDHPAVIYINPSSKREDVRAYLEELADTVERSEEWPPLDLEPRVVPRDPDAVALLLRAAEIAEKQPDDDFNLDDIPF